jgi:hypothetical protein
MRPRLSTEVAAPADRVWDELVELDRWPAWGPTVRAARLDDGSRRLHRSASGAVQTTVGVWLPFQVDDWHDDGVRRAWSWRVAGVAATTHAVTAVDAERCRVEMTVPWWAPGYLGVVGLALRRIRRRAETRAG